MTTTLPIFPSFPVNSKPDSHLTTGIRWAKYLSRFENMLVGYAITEDKRKKALLLHYAGEEVYDIFETLPDTGEDYKTCKEKLTAYCNPRKNVEFEIFTFREAKQNPEETLDSFHTRLRELSINCEFDNVDREIKSQIIAKCSSIKLRKSALRDPDLDLTRILAQGRAAEQADQQITEMNKSHPKIQSQPCETHDM